MNARECRALGTKITMWKNVIVGAIGIPTKVTEQWHVKKEDEGQNVKCEAVLSTNEQRAGCSQIGETAETSGTLERSTLKKMIQKEKMGRKKPISVWRAALWIFFWKDSQTNRKEE